MIKIVLKGNDQARLLANVPFDDIKDWTDYVKKSRGEALMRGATNETN